MYIFSLILLSVFTLFSTLSFITPLIKRIATAKGWVDDPSQSSRKVHTKPVPYLGGVAMYVGFLMGVGAFFVFFPQLRGELSFPSWFLAYLAGGTLILVIGTADDIYDISAAKKLIAQVVIAYLVYLGGVQLDHIILPYFGMIEFGPLAAPITVFFIVGMMNAVNLIDGLDGLAGGIVLLAAVANAIVAAYLGNQFILFIALLLAASVVGFLKHNWYRSSIFLGDGGSLLIGYLIAVVSLQNISAADNVVEVLIPLSLFVYPILDVFMAMFRRIWRGKPVMSADRAHIHHRLLEQGISHEGAVKIILFFAAAIAMSCIIYLFGMTWLSIVLALLAFGGTLLGLFLLNYFDPKEFRIGMRLRPQFQVHNAYKKLAFVKMRYATSEDELWKNLNESASELGLSSLRWDDSGALRSWGAQGEFGKAERVPLEKTRGLMEFSVCSSEEGEMQTEIDLIIRQLILRFDTSLHKIRRRDPHGNGFTGNPY